MGRAKGQWEVTGIPYLLPTPACTTAAPTGIPATARKTETRQSPPALTRPARAMSVAEATQLLCPSRNRRPRQTPSLGAAILRASGSGVLKPRPLGASSRAPSGSFSAAGIPRVSGASRACTGGGQNCCWCTCHDRSFPRLSSRVFSLR